MTAAAIALPAAQVIGAGVITSRIPWRSHPALIVWMLSEALMQGWALMGASMPWAVVVKIAILSAVVGEVLVYSRVGRAHIGTLAALAVTAAAFAAGARTDISDLERQYLFRSWFLVAPCLVLIAATIYRSLRPVLECRRHKVYRIGATAWLIGITAPGAFVRGGIGYMIFPRTMATWSAVNIAAYVFLIATITGMSLAMCLSVAPRKRTAKAQRVPAREEIAPPMAA